MKGNIEDDNELIITVQDVAEYARLNNVDVAKLSEEESEQLMNRIQLNKRQTAIMHFVNRYHVTSKGVPRKIYEPTSKDGLWYTQDPKNPKNKIRGKTVEALYQKLYDYYKGSAENTVESWFETGIKYRIRKSNPRQSTIDRHRRTLKSYFTEELLNTDIRDITSMDIWDFMKEAQQDHKMSLSETKQLKGTLNLIFEAASDPEIGCINYNPVDRVNPSGLFKNNAEALRCNHSKREFSAFSQEQIALLRKTFMERIEENRGIRYDRCTYALMGLLASYTGMRASELPALMWEDIKDNHIHIHQMQTRNDGEHGDARFEIVPWLKEEKGSPRGGRSIPFLTDEIPQLFYLIKDIQKSFGIESEWVFPDSNSLSYERSMYKLCKKLGFETTNNHAFRKAFNMWMLSMGLNVADRSKILGHSPAVNLDHYTVIADNWIEDTIQKANSNQVTTETGLVTTNIRKFTTHKKGFKPA